VTIDVYEPEDQGIEPGTYEFAMIFKRDGVRESHEFLAQPNYSWQNLRGMIHLLESRRGEISMQALAQVDRLVRRSLVNTDGTPERWRPSIVEPDDGSEPWFTDPNGDHTPVDLLPAYETFDAGSSRRRWVHLMEADDEVTVDAGQITRLVRKLMEIAGKDPGKRSAPSPVSPRIALSAPG